MTTREIIIECEARQNEGAEISNACARAIAAQFQDGPRDPLAVFASGAPVGRAALIDAVSDEIRRSYVGASEGTKLMLDMLGTYAQNAFYPVGTRVTCDGDPGTVEWSGVDHSDARVAFDDGDRAYVHPSDLKSI